MSIKNVSKNEKIADHIRIAATFWRRLKGLLGTSELPAGEALFIKPCSSVHTFGMNYPIDVIFVNSDNRVLKTVENMGPRRVAACFGSNYVLELPAGTLALTHTEAGDILAVFD